MVDPREATMAGGDVSGSDRRLQNEQPGPVLKGKRRVGKRWPFVLGLGSRCHRYSGYCVGLGLVSPVGCA
jgi:hypothetical protein